MGLYRNLLLNHIIFLKILSLKKKKYADLRKSYNNIHFFILFRIY